MQLRRTLIGTCLAALATASLVAGPAQAQDNGDPNSCTYNPRNQIASYHLEPGGGGFMEIDVENDLLVYYDAFGKNFCKNPATGQPATRDMVDSVLFSGTSGADDFIVSELSPGGLWTGGAPGGADPFQMEITVVTDGLDTLDVVGADTRSDFIAVHGGAGTGKQGTLDLQSTFTQKPGLKLALDPKLVRVNGLGASDILSGSVFGAPTSMHLELHGGAGDDTINGGLLAGDRLVGDEGDDTFTAKDGQPGDNVTGGTGVDTATIDPTDQAFGVEKFLHPVGTPSVTAGPVAADGSATVKVSWTHPASWRNVRSLTLAAYDGAKQVGSVSMSPKSGELSARGALRLGTGSTLSHKGKTVTAKLGLKVAPALAGKSLRLKVSATDTGGHRQAELAGLLQAMPAR